MKNVNKIQITLLLLTVAIILCFINCGYNLSGAGNNLPENVKSIAIPDFDNLTPNPDAQQYITFAIRDEFIKRSKLKLTNDLTTADLVLEGKIKRFIVEPVSFTSRVSANLYRVSLILDVKLINTKNNKIIFKSNRLRFSEDYDIDSADFFSQEGATIDKIAKDIASTIVTGILENF